LKFFTTILRSTLSFTLSIEVNVNLLSYVMWISSQTMNWNNEWIYVRETTLIYEFREKVM